MKTKRILSLIMALVMVASFSVFAYADAEPEPDVPAVEEFVLDGYYNDGLNYDGTVQALYLNGIDIANYSDLSDPLTFEPGAEVEIELILGEGCTIGDDLEYVDPGVWFYWYGESTYTDDIEGLGVSKDDIEYVNGELNHIKATIYVPSADWLENDVYISLCFYAYGEGDKEGLITKVVINAPKIKAGEGFTCTEEEDGFIVQTPPPAVSVDEDAPYYIQLSGEDPEAYWLESEGGPHPYDYNVCHEDTVFEDGTWYYIGIVIYPKNEIGPIPPFQSDDPRAVKSAEAPVWNYFSPYEAEWPEVVVNNGELVTFSVMGGYYGEDYSSPYGDAYLVAVVRVRTDSGSPNTGDINPVPWVMAIVLSATFIVMILDEDRRRFANR